MKTFGRRTLAAVLSVIMVLSCFAGLTFSVGAETSGDYEYYIRNDGTLDLVSYNGTDTEVIIPEKIDGYIVSHVQEAFTGCNKIVSLTLSSNISDVCSDSFLGCTDLEKIYVDNNSSYYSSINGILFDKDKRTLIEFPNNNKSVEYTIPDGVTSINYSAFSACKNLKKVIIPDSVTSIGSDAFHGCTNIENIVMSNNLEYIGEYAFYNCSSLTSVTIPGGLIQFYGTTFAGCNSLKEIIVNENNKNYKLYEGILFNKDMTKIVLYPPCRQGNEYTIPDGVTEVGSFAFSGCSKLTNIYIPDSVTDIDSYAFSGCSSLIRVTIPNGITSIEYGAFEECTGLINIIISDSVTHIYFGAFGNCYNLKGILIPKNILYLDDYVFGYTFNSNNWEYDKIANFTIYGYPNTAAEKYAKENGFEFIDISSCKHTETELENRKEATCTEAGYSGDEHCKNCTMLIKNGAEIPALGHSEETIKGKPATCTETGLTDGIKCSVCGEIIKAQEEIPAVGHTFDKGVCTACGAIDPDYKVVLNSLNEQIKVDNESKSVSMAPAKTSGMKVSEFKKQFDGEISVDIDDNSLVANGTKFKFGSNEFTVIVKGDVQADGKITASDARMVLRIAARLESVDANAFGAADINGDGKVSPSEARKVLRFVARLENTIE